MDLVTLAEITLHRVGSMSVTGVSNQKEVSGTFEIADEKSETMRELVLSVAEQNGEPRERLNAMAQVSTYQYTPDIQAVVYNIQPSNVQYGAPCATCRSFPALKIGSRYFRLDEVVLRQL